MVDADEGAFLHIRLGVEGNAHSSDREHGEIIRAVANRNGVGGVEPKVLGDAAQRLDLGLLAEDRMADLAGQSAVPDDQVIGLMLMEAEFRRNALREGREAAGDEGRVCAMRLHGGGQGAPAGHKGDALRDNALDDPGIQPLEQLHALGEGTLEIEFAAHGAGRDVPDAGPHARHLAELIDAFLLDHGRVHVGDEQALAAVVDRDHGGVDGVVADVHHELGKPLEIRDFAGFPGGEPMGRAAAQVPQQVHDAGIDCAGPRGCYENENGIHMTATSAKPVLLIAGPTASGKSALALELAAARNGVIINADALQVYAELRILSARPSAAEEALVPHRMYGHVSGTEVYSVGRWLTEASAAIAACWAAGQLPIVVGGTGLYFKALEQGLAQVPPIDEAVRAGWRRFAGDLHAELAARDPEGAAALAPADRHRLLRALEVLEGTGRPLRHWQKAAQSTAILADAQVERLFRDVPRGTLHERAGARFDQMMVAGALEEVRAVLDYDPALPMMKAIGVPELSAALRGEIPLAEAVTQAKAATRQFIKRQFTWWRGQLKEGWASV